MWRGGLDRLVVRLLVPLALLFAACGGSATPSAAPGGPVSTEAATREEASAAPARGRSESGTIPVVPTDLRRYGGQDRLGAPGLASLLFFDADG